MLPTKASRAYTTRSAYLWLPVTMALRMKSGMPNRIAKNPKGVWRPKTSPATTIRENASPVTQHFSKCIVFVTTSGSQAHSSSSRTIQMYHRGSDAKRFSAGTRSVVLAGSKLVRRELARKRPAPSPVRRYRSWRRPFERRVVIMQVCCGQRTKSYAMTFA